MLEGHEPHSRNTFTFSLHLEFDWQRNLRVLKLVLYDESSRVPYLSCLFFFPLQRDFVGWHSEKCELLFLTNYISNFSMICFSPTVCLKQILFKVLSWRLHLHLKQRSSMLNLKPKEIFQFKWLKYCIYQSSLEEQINWIYIKSIFITLIYPIGSG